jgi:tetratricopeptide (TPR) repeat protein
MHTPAAQADSKTEYFISRAGADRALARFIAQIIREAGGEPFYQDESFGHADFMRRMEQAYARTARTIALLSGDYQKSEFCRTEYNNVLGKDPPNLQQRLVVLRVADCQPEGNLQNLAYTDLVPVLNDLVALKRVVRVALGFDTRPSEIDFLKFYQRTRQQIRHPEIRPVRGFTGRDELLAALGKKLWHGSAIVAIRDTGEASVALRGLGGVGKTVLAKQYAWENREKYHGIWWIRAGKHETLIDDLVALGARFIPGLESLEPEKGARATLDQIAQMRTDKPWLLVYDNVDDQAAVREWTPAENAHVLITTRLTQWHGAADELPVDVFDPETAIDFLVSESVNKDRAAAGRLADTLGRLPLALSHARAYCAERNWPFDQYVAKLPELIRRKPKGAEYPDAVFATFSLAIEKAAANCAEAERVLGLLAFLAPDQVPLWLISADVLSEDRRDEALAALNAVSLVRLENLPDGTPGVSVHRLVQEVIRGRLSEQGRAPEVAAEATRLVDKGYDDSYSFESLAKNTHLLPHALVVLQHAPQDGEASQQTLWVTGETGDFRLSRGESLAALDSYNAARAIADRLAKADPGNAGWQRDLSVSHERIGDVLRAQGNLPAAFASYQASLAIRDRLATVDPGNTGWQRDLSVAHNKIGDVLRAQGNLPAALASYRASLAIADHLARADPGNAGWQRDLSVSHERIGDVLRDQGNLPAALASYRASLAIADHLASADPGNAGWQSDLSVSHDRIGAVLVEQGNLPAALASYQASLAIRDRLATADPGNAGWQRNLSVSHNKIGDVLRAQSNLPAALARYQASLAIADRLARADPGNAGWQRDLSVPHERIGVVLVEQGNLPAALANYHASLAIRDRLATADPGNAGWQRDVALSHGLIAMVLAQQGEWDRARDAFRRGREIIARLRESSPDNATLPKDLAWFDSQMSDLR